MPRLSIQNPQSGWMYLTRPSPSTLSACSIARAQTARRNNPDCEVQRAGLEARPAIPRCSVRGWADGAASTLHCRRTRPRRRSLHAAPLRRAVGEGTATDIGAHQAALAIRKASGSRLGNPANLIDAGDRGRASATSAADEHAGRLLSVLRAIQAESAQRIGAITTALNARRVPTPRGASWHVSSVAIC